MDYRWIPFTERNPTPEESLQGLAFLFDWNGGPQIAGGTFEDGKAYQDGGDLQGEIFDVTHFFVLPNRYNRESCPS